MGMTLRWTQEVVRVERTEMVEAHRSHVQVLIRLINELLITLTPAADVSQSFLKFFIKTTCAVPVNLFTAAFKPTCSVWRSCGLNVHMHRALVQNESLGSCLSPCVGRRAWINSWGEET